MTKTKFHITIGHQTAIGLVHFFSSSKTEDTEKLIFNKGSLKNQEADYQFNFNHQYNFETEMKGELPPGAAPKEESKTQEAPEIEKVYFAIIQLEKPILIQEQSLLIASKLDMDIGAKQCRLSFYGQAVQLIKEPEVELPKINVIKEKLKIGKLDRITDASNILVRDLFQKETNPDVFIGLKITLAATGQKGQI